MGMGTLMTKVRLIAGSAISQPTMAFLRMAQPGMKSAGPAIYYCTVMGVYFYRWMTVA